MRRRELLKHAAVLPLLPGLVRGAPRPAPLQRVRPGQPGWPADDAWRQLRAALQGELIAVPPPFAPCAEGSSGEACQELLKELSNPFFLGDQPAGTQVSGWLDAWTPAPSAYAVRARNAADMAAAVNFAREHRLRVVIKGSCAPDSLLLWTRGLQQIELHEASCRRAPARAPCRCRR